MAAPDQASRSPLHSRWPAEWEPQERCWIGWPDRHDWYPWQASSVQDDVVRLASAISKFLPVTILANPAQAEKARAMLPKAVTVKRMPLETPYIRDTAPLFVIHTEDGRNAVAGVDFKFNVYGATQATDGKWYTKWGSLYAEALHDAELAQSMLQSLNIRRLESSMVLEGGSIHTDGQGTLITTAECLLNENRNPHMSREDIEAELGGTLGVTKFIWLPRGVFADWVTNGHVDNFCCFARPGVVLLAWTDDQSDAQWAISNEALQMLSASTDAQGRQFQIHKIPLPGPLYLTTEEAENRECTGPVKRKAGDRLPASYINFYLGNGGAVIPAFGEPTDEPARRAIQEAFGPSITVVSTPARSILLGGGNIHCMSMQQAKLQTSTL